MTASARLSRFGLILCALGMAVGTGNIWRFPRILAQNGGGVFVALWLLFLFAWSIPLMVAEFGLGRMTRRGCVGAAAAVGGPWASVMGGFVALCTAAITAYYAVVAGWCLRYLGAAVAHPSAQWGAAAEQAFVRFADSWTPVGYQAAVLLAAGLVLSAGVVRGFERANTVLMPALFALLLVAAGVALSGDGAAGALHFMFSFDAAQLGDVDVWLAALTQSAWSTGAGWGLVLTLGAYTRDDQNIARTALITGVGNNAASLLAASAIIPVVFAVAPAVMPPHVLAQAGGVDGLLRQGGPASTGLTFVWLPALFAHLPGGRWWTAAFFLGLVIAAFSSLLAMVEMVVRVFEDRGVSRRRALWATVSVLFLAGLPSAVRLSVFQNQDWVWALGLLLSGFFVSRLALRRADFWQRAVGGGPGWLGVAFARWLRWGVPVLFASVLGWWLYQAYTWDPRAFWNPVALFSGATVLVQWAVAFAVLLVWLRPWRQPARDSSSVTE